MSDDEVIDDPVLLSGELLDAVATWDAVAILDRVPTRETAAVLHRLVADAKRNLALAEDTLAEFLFDVCGSGRMELDGLPPFEVKVGRDRKEWDHDGVARDLVPAIVQVLFGADDVELVRLDEGTKVTARFLVGNVVARLRESSSDGWKVTGLRSAGLDPDEYCRSARGRVSVQWT